MFVLYNQTEQRVPIKVWLPGRDLLEEECLRQALNLSNLPFAFKHIALMPDTHAGFGMPIGGVLATEDVIIPNAVGVDIGCGMVFAHTNVPARLLREVSTPGGTLAHYLVGQIMREVPQGFDHHKVPQKSQWLDDYPVEKLYRYGAEKLPKKAEAYVQLGTLGGGNHFIELQEDEEGLLGLMVHTGSRNFGYKVANYFNQLAKQLNKRMGSQVPSHFDLAYLPIDSQEGKGYIGWMTFALEFARQNRQRIMQRVQGIVADGLRRYAGVQDVRFLNEVNAHHNYAALETHFGRRVWVHRKGAISAKAGEPGIIPGAMGSYSFIVEGLGNPESFHSASHGAGRVMGRKEAVRQFSVEEVLADFARKDMVLGKRRRGDTAEEYYKAYKNIEDVMKDQRDLVKPILKLRTVAVVKG
ncbi:MAG: RtcB family protein [Firmicutes bacterium]|nr:RtcB family protein [Bacillota bacterium]